MDNLRPLENVHKFLLSSPCHFVGEYVGDDILLTHAFPLGNPELLAGYSGGTSPLARTHLVLVLRTEIVSADKKNLAFLNSGSVIGEQFCVYLSVLFGKRFDQHGLFESTGLFQLPELQNLAPVFNRWQPFNSAKLRVDLPLDFNLANFHLVAKALINQSIDNRVHSLFISAGRYYVRALRLYQTDPELAFLDLVTCGEVLANYFTFSPAELYDPHFRSILREIQEASPSGPKFCREIEKRLVQVRRRYTLGLLRLLTPTFFDRTEAPEPSAGLTQDAIESRLKASYDLRSRYLHTGVSFSEWLSLPSLAEIQPGKPVIEPPDFADELHNCPTFLGTRACHAIFTAPFSSSLRSAY